MPRALAGIDWREADSTTPTETPQQIETMCTSLWLKTIEWLAPSTFVKSSGAELPAAMNVAPATSLDLAHATDRTSVRAPVCDESESYETCDHKLAMKATVNDMNHIVFEGHCGRCMRASMSCKEPR